MIQTSSASASTRRRVRAAAGAAVLAITIPGAALSGLSGLSGVATASTTAPGADEAQLYVVHAIAGVTAELSVDGEVVAAGAEPKDVVGPLTVTPGEHVVQVAVEGAEPISATVEIDAGGSADVVAHQGEDPDSDGVLTVFPNDLSAVAPGKARLVVAHTATVPPADIRVDGEVLFRNVANGEALTLVVPGGSYSVDVVPASTDGPVVLGPVDLAVAGEQLNRVYAFGDPAASAGSTMDAIVRTQPLPVEGASQPDEVDTGTGGWAGALGGNGLAAAALVGVAVVAVVGAVAPSRRRSASPAR